MSEQARAAVEPLTIREQKCTIIVRRRKVPPRDVIAITDANGSDVAKYRYDAWGVCTVLSDTSLCSISTVNPYRYRSYYFDNDISLYYLQSRYYDPAIC